MSLNVELFTVAGFSGSLKITVTGLDAGALFSRLAGEKLTIVGATLSPAGATVVNVTVKLLARALPARSLTPVVTVRVYVVFWASGDDGVKVAVFEPGAGLCHHGYRGNGQHQHAGLEFGEQLGAVDDLEILAIFTQVFLPDSHGVVVRRIAGLHELRSQCTAIEINGLLGSRRQGG